MTVPLGRVLVAGQFETRNFASALRLARPRAIGLFNGFVLIWAAAPMIRHCIWPLLPDNSMVVIQGSQRKG